MSLQVKDLNFILFSLHLGTARTNIIVNSLIQPVFFIFSVSQLGLKNKITKGNSRNSSSHWLDSVRHKYDKRFINDVKKTLSVLKLFAVLPIFWALVDQMVNLTYYSIYGE